MTYTVLSVVSAIDLPFQISLELAERAQARALVFADPAVGDVVDGNGIEVVQLLAPAPECRHEIRFLQNSEMFGYRLAGHAVPFAKLGQCLPVAGTQAVQQLPPDRIGKRPENRIHAHAGQHATIWLLFQPQNGGTPPVEVACLRSWRVSHRQRGVRRLACRLSPRAGAARRDIRSDAGGRGTRARAGSRSAPRREARRPGRCAASGRRSPPCRAAPARRAPWRWRS